MGKITHQQAFQNSVKRVNVHQQWFQNRLIVMWLTRAAWERLSFHFRVPVFPVDCRRISVALLLCWIAPESFQRVSMAYITVHCCMNVRQTKGNLYAAHSQSLFALDMSVCSLIMNTKCSSLMAEKEGHKSEWLKACGLENQIQRFQRDFQSCFFSLSF